MITASQYPAHLPEYGGSLNGWLDAVTNPFGWLKDQLLGKPQSWYTRVEQAQNAFAVISAEVNAFGRSVWDSIQSSIAAEVEAGRGAGLPTRFPGFSWAVDDIATQAKALLITKSHVPSDWEISTAENRIPMYREAVNYAKYIVPEKVVEVEQDAAKVADAVSRAPLRSPNEVGMETFLAELEKRMKLFGMFGLATIAIIGAAAVAGFMLYAKFMAGGRR